MYLSRCTVSPPPAVSICRAWVVITLLFVAAGSSWCSHDFGWFFTTVTAHISIIQPGHPPSLSFSAFPLVKAQVQDWGPHHTSSTLGLLPPFPLLCWGTGSVLVFCMLGWWKALIGSLSTLPMHRAFQWHVTQPPLHSSPSARSFQQWRTVSTWIQCKRQLIDFSVKYFTAGCGLPGTDSSGLMPGDSILQH